MEHLTARDHAAAAVAAAGTPGQPAGDGGQASSTVSWPRRWLGEPLLLFLLVGALLFGLYRWLNPEPVPRAGNRIVVTEDDLRQMSAQWRAQGRPSPTPDQWRSLIETKVREEVLYREALALGLDRDDTIVTRRLAQKMEFLAEDLSALSEPGPAELEAWFAANQAQFTLPPRASFPSCRRRASRRPRPPAGTHRHNDRPPEAGPLRRREGGDRPADRHRAMSARA